MLLPDETEALVLKCKAGDRSAFEALVEEYEGRLQSVLRARIGVALRGRIQAEDIVQETFLRAFQSIGEFRWRGEDSFYRWLCGIAEHLIWNASQKRSGGEMKLTHDVVASTVSPSKGLRREERFQRLKMAMACLSVDQREAIQLAKIDGLKVNEIALRMKRSPDSVKQLLSRGLRQLRESFGDTESLHLPDRGLESEARGHGH
jgi:RNA polymerase sigma-70 factor (ECF subfamily)